MERRNETLLFIVSVCCTSANSSDGKDKTKHQFPKSTAITKFSAEFCDPPCVDLTAVVIKSINFGCAAAPGLK